MINVENEKFVWGRDLDGPTPLERAVSEENEVEGFTGKRNPVTSTGLYQRLRCFL